MKDFFRVGIFLILLFTLLGCDDNKEKDQMVSDVETQMMPIEMPDDFNFNVKFGINMKNEINTYDNTVTKDLISNGTVSTNLSFTNEEMAMIYEKMKEINIAGKKQINSKDRCMKEPFSEDEWTITIDGEIVEHYFSDNYCSPTNDAQQMLQLRKYVLSIVKNHEAYKKLPDAEGAYE